MHVHHLAVVGSKQFVLQALWTALLYQGLIRCKMKCAARRFPSAVSSLMSILGGILFWAVSYKSVVTCFAGM